MQSKPTITKQILIKHLIDNYSFSASYLKERGICCIICGDPVLGTLEEAAKAKGFSDEAIAKFILEINQIAEESDTVLVELRNH